MNFDKEELKKRRKELYQQAKKRRESDPRFIAYREQQKQARRDFQKKAKEKRRAEKDATHMLKRAQKHAALLGTIKTASEILDSGNHPISE